MSSNLADEPTLADVPPFETAWQKTDSYTFPYHQWEPIWNGQLIRKYRNIPVQWQINRYIETNTQLDIIGRWTPPSQASRDACHTITPTTGSIAHIDTKADGPPIETARALSELYALQCCQWEPIQNSQLIRKYKEIPVHRENM